MEPLLRFRFVRRVDDGYIEITRGGLTFLRPANDSSETLPSVAGRVEPAPFKPLSPKYFASHGLRREGADDFRKHPSLMGGVRVPYWGNK